MTQYDEIIRTSDGAIPNDDLPKVATASANSKNNHRGPVSYPPVPFKLWAILFVCSAGVLMAAVSTTALVIAFPTLLEKLDSSITTMMWILLVVLLMIASVTGISGKLGDVVGQIVLFKFGYFFFLVGCLFAGFAQKKYHGNDLLAARILIGFGAAFIFSNSAAILTNCFHHYGRVGLAQGIYQLAAASGTVLGPVIGGALSNDQFRWIFWWNVPVTGICLLISFWAITDEYEPKRNRIPWAEAVKRFDWIGATFYPLGMALLIIAMVQAVVPDPNLSKSGPLAGLIAGGCISGLIFIISEFFVADPIVAPELFLKNRVFTVSTIAATALSYVRSSITFNFIFYLQGPKSKSALVAGLILIPFGLGIMFAGFISGSFADRIRSSYMTVTGPLLTAVAVIVIIVKFDDTTSTLEIGGMLFLCGIGLGLFNSPNRMVNILSVDPNQRGVAAAVAMISQMFTNMLAIVMTFSLVLNSMSQEALFSLFIYGGASLDSHTLSLFLEALRADWYAVLACCILASMVSVFDTLDETKLRPQMLPHHHHQQQLNGSTILSHINNNGNQILSEQLGDLELVTASRNNEPSSSLREEQEIEQEQVEVIQHELEELAP